MITPDAIPVLIEKVAAEYSLDTSDLTGRGRTQEVAEARQVVFFLLWKDDWTLKQIGEALGGRTPATVSHGADTIRKRLLLNVRLFRLINRAIMGFNEYYREED